LDTRALISRKWVAIILLALAVILVLPPILHSYIYPNGGDDSGIHMTVIEQITPSQPIPKLIDYGGEVIVGYPMILARDYLHIPLPVSFMWFTYLALVGAMLTIYFVTSKLFGQISGLLTTILAVFVVGIILQQFLAGLIFNLINMSIIFLWLAYFLVTAIAKKKWKLLIPVGVIGALFMVFHASGRYITGIGGIIKSLTVFNPVSDVDLKNYLLVAVIMVFVSAVGGIFALREWNINRRASLFIILLSIACVGLTIVGLPMLTISPVPVRQLQDAINLSIIIAGFVSSIWLRKLEPQQAVSAVVVVGVLGIAMITPQWLVRNFSALQPADKQAIAYIKTLDEGTFYGNEYIAPWIYSHYIGKEYKPDTGVYIWRSVPMTMKTRPDNDTYWSPQGNDIAVPVNVKSMKTFASKGIVIYVAEVSQ
jgi:hypothetical protein